MKLSETTQNLIKNFSTINKSLLVREGTTLTTISPSKSIYAKAKVSEDFPKRCAIYELNRFLGAYSLFEDPNIEFQDNQLAITDGKHTVQYTYASENAIVAPPEKDIKIPSEDITFKLPASEFSGLIRAANVLSLKNVVVTNEDGEFKVSARDHKNPNSDEYSANVTEYTSDSSSFSIIFSVENLMKLLVKDYTVTIASAGISRFESPEVTYFVALENDSEFQ